LGFGEEEWSFAGLVFVSFSAFDDFQLPDGVSQKLRVTVVGLHKNADSEDKVPNTKTPKELAADFVESFALCRQGLRSERWRAAVKTLENDPLFEEANFSSLLELSNDTWKAESKRMFGKLSSGHAVVLLTITRLVESVDERTLVLLDEPEGHLHPPLLSAFIRSLADLLVKRNGVAIVATHSPVVLQEVPRSCVWVLRRAGDLSRVQRPSIETFGESVGILTREVFGLEVTNAGFHKLLKEAVNDGTPNLEQVVLRFDGQMGAEARAIASALIAERDSSES
jgi:predicted ATPase